MKLHKIINLSLCFGISLILGACGGGSAGSGSSDGSGAATLFTLGGSISGLNAGNQVTFQVVLSNGTNSQDSTSTATVSSNGTFATPPLVPANGSYVVLVTNQPAGQTCTVTNAAGNNVTANVTNLNVVCSATVFTVSGVVTGLLPGQEVTLLNNYANPLVVNGNAAFTFTTPVALGSGYFVTVSDAPLMTTCTVNQGAGLNVSADITTVNVSCGVSDSVLYSFTGYPDAYGPTVGLVQGSNGNFYGTTGLGGTYANGTGRGAIFEITPAGAESILHSFTGSGSPIDGACPQASLLQLSNGSFYGTTCIGGANDLGTVFSVNSDGTESILWSFGSGTDGQNSYGALILGSDGNLYGTNPYGGAHGTGSVFKIAPGGGTGSESVLYSFAASSADGHFPHAGLILGADKNFYGTTYGGGTYGAGTVFRLTPGGAETVLVNFGSTSTDGNMATPTTSIEPAATLVQYSDGNFYGTTPSGGTYNNGTVYMITPGGVKTQLYSFASGAGDGQTPQAGLLLANDGNFYGTTVSGGANNKGTVFKITPAGVETLMYSFGGTGDGANPYAPLIQAADGHLYVPTDNGGVSGVGAVVKF